MDRQAWGHGPPGHQSLFPFSRYRNKRFKLPDGTQRTVLTGQEKGIDVRISLDIFWAVLREECDVVVVFSQDQDLSEVAEEVRVLAREQKRWIKIASAFPVSPTYENRRGIDKTDWIRIDRATYDGLVKSPVSATH